MPATLRDSCRNGIASCRWSKKRTWTAWSASGSGAWGWSLDDLARRCHVSPSNLSRIEAGHRRIALDQLAVIARALGTTLDQLVESPGDDDVVIRPRRDVVRGATTWLLTS